MAFRTVIDGQNAGPLIEAAIAAIGPMLDPEPADAGVIRHYDGKVPDIMLDIWENYGFGDLAGGRLRLCIPAALKQAVQMLFEGDPYLGGDTTLLAYTAFGDLVLWNARHQMVYVNMQLSLVEAPALLRPELLTEPDKAVYQGLLRREAWRNDTYDAEGRPMFPLALEAYGPLPPLSIYGMQPAVPFDEPFSVENHRPVPAEDWLEEKIGGSVFSLGELPGPRLQIRDIGPLQPGETLQEPGSL